MFWDFNIRSFSPLLLQSVLRKLTPEDAPKISDQVMNCLLRMFQSSTGKSGGVQEDGLLALATLVEGGSLTWNWSLLQFVIIHAVFDHSVCFYHSNSLKNNGFLVWWCSWFKYLKILKFKEVYSLLNNLKLMKGSKIIIFITIKV